MPQILSGTDYLNTSAGVGALVLDKNDDLAKDIIGQFNTTTNYLNQWKNDKLNRDKIEYEQFQKNLSDVYLDTKGANPTDADYFKNLQQDIYKRATDLMKRYSNPFDKNYLLTHSGLKNETKAYQALANASVEQQNHIDNSYKYASELAKLGKLDTKKTAENIRQYATMPISERVKLGTPNLVVAKSKTLADYIDEAFDPKNNEELKPLKFAEERGNNIVKGERTSRDPYLQILTKKIAGDPDFRDLATEHLSKIPPENLSYIHRLATEKGLGNYSPEVLALWSFVPEPRESITDLDEKKSVGDARDLAKQKEIIKYQAKTTKGTRRDKFDNITNELFNVATSNFANEKDGLRVQTKMLLVPVGAKAKDNEEDAYLSDFKVVTAENGTISYRFTPKDDFANYKAGQEYSINDIRQLYGYHLAKQYGANVDDVSEIFEMTEEKLRKFGGDFNRAGEARKGLMAKKQAYVYKPASIEKSKEAPKVTAPKTLQKINNPLIKNTAIIR